MSAKKPTESAIRAPAKDVQPSKTLASRQNPVLDGTSPNQTPRSAPKFKPHSAAMKGPAPATASVTKTTPAVGTVSRKPAKATDSAAPKPVLNTAKKPTARVATGADKSATVAKATATPQSKNGTLGATPRKPQGLAIAASSNASAPLAPVSKSGTDITISTKANGTPTTYLATSSSEIPADHQPSLTQLPMPVTSQPDQSASHLAGPSNSHAPGPLTNLSASTKPSLKVGGGPRVSQVWKEKLTEEIIELMNHIQEEERIKNSLVVSRNAARQDLENANEKIKALSLEVKELREENTKVSAENEQHKATIRALEVQVSTSEERARTADERLRNMTVKRYDTKAMMMAVEQKAKQEELESQVTRLRQKLQESTSNCDSWRMAAEVKSADYHSVQRKLDEATVLIEEMKQTKEELDRQLQEITENEEKTLSAQMEE